MPALYFFFLLTNVSTTTAKKTLPKTKNENERFVNWNFSGKIKQPNDDGINAAAIKWKKSSTVRLKRFFPGIIEYVPAKLPTINNTITNQGKFAFIICLFHIS
jgi:hypothetical protein